MEIITKKYEVYKFEELDKEVQEKLLEEQIKRECENYCESCLCDDMENKAQELLQEYFQGAVFDSVYYDLGYSQGSGAQINFDINILDLNKKYNFLSKKAIKFIEAVGLQNFKVKHSGWYYHEKAFIIDWFFIDDFSYCDDFLKDEEVKTINDKIENIINEDFFNDIAKMNVELKKYGYDLIENEEYFKNIALDQLKSYSYLKDGKVFEEEVEGC